MDNLIYNNIDYGPIVLKCIVGSHAHGTNIPESDIDIKGVYVQSPESVLEIGYKELIEVDNDTVYYELKRFVELCCSANPTMLELLFINDGNCLYRHISLDTLFEKRNEFLTKKLNYSFGGYVVSQISKAEGLDKKINWDKEKTKRKNPIDFCYVALDKNTNVLRKDDGSNWERIYKGVYPLKDWLNRHSYEETEIILNKLNHTKEGYQLFFSSKPTKGITTDKSNLLRVESSDINAMPIATMFYNSDNYSKHCTEYRQYKDWLNKRNTQRYVDIENHGQMIDGKNMLHCVRLLETGLEISKGLGFNVKRPNADYLISIRKGKVDLATIVKESKIKLDEMTKSFKSSNLKDKVRIEDYRDIIKSIRKSVKYEI